MQRASPKTGISSPKTPTQPATPLSESRSQAESHPATPPLKRRKLSSDAESPASATLDLGSSITAAIAERERIRSDALARHTDARVAERESQWVLEYPGVKVVEPEEGEDAEMDVEERAVGRRTFGNFKRKRYATVEKVRNGDIEADDDDGGDEDAEDDEVRIKSGKKRRGFDDERVSGVYESKAQKKLRNGIDPDKVNLQGLGRLSGQKKKKKHKENGFGRGRGKGNG